MNNQVVMELNVSLNALINATPDSFYDYVEEAAIEAGLLPPSAFMTDASYTLLRHEGNELWIEVSFEVSE